MSNEIIKNYTIKIKEYEIDIKNNYIKIARCLNEIKYYNYLDGTEYKNIYDYSLQKFGFERSQTANLISVYEKFFAEEVRKNIGFSNLKYGKYSITQLVHMLNMSDELLKKCSPDFSVSEIKKIKVSIRMDSDNVENNPLLKNDNVVTGVFLDKKQDEKEEEKQKTIIISELPKTSPVQEEKTVTTITETITSQNLDFETNKKSEFDKINDSYNYMKKNCDNFFQQNLKLEAEINNLNSLLEYFYIKFISINEIQNNSDVKILKQEINNFIINKKLPDKLKFMQEVI